MSKTIKRTPTS